MTFIELGTGTQTCATHFAETFKNTSQNIKKNRKNMKNKDELWKDIDFIRHELGNEKLELKCLIKSAMDSKKKLEELEDELEDIIIKLDGMEY